MAEARRWTIGQGPTEGYPNEDCVEGPPTNGEVEVVEARALDQANSRAEEAEAKLEELRAAAQEHLKAISQWVNAATHPDELPAAVARVDETSDKVADALSTLPKPSSPIPATKDALNPTNVDLFPKPPESGSEVEGE